MASRLDALAKPLLSLVALGLTFLVLECSLRAYHKLRYDVPLRPGPAGLARYVEQGSGSRLSPIVLDDLRGWRATPHYAVRGTRRNSDGSPYDAEASFDARGFRVFGDPASPHRRILVLGDSFTQAVEVSDDKTYAAIIGRSQGAELFVYGVGGYGTLQEYLSLDAYLEQIQPDILLWQYCSNDFVNNVPELERDSIFSNNGLVRPYRVDGETIYLLPKADPLGLRSLTTRHSRFAYWALSRWDIVQARFLVTPIGTVERDIEQQGFQHAGFSRAVEVTDRLMAEVRRRAGGVPIVGFSCDDRWPYHGALEHISERHGILFAPVGRVVDEAEQRGSISKMDDGHWNEHGHRLAAEVIETRLWEAGLIP